MCRPTGRCSQRSVHYAGTKQRSRSNPLGKPPRCRDCMVKVESGKASKEDLAKEREVIKEARTKAQKEMGTKLFVGGISYDATEEEISRRFAMVRLKTFTWQSIRRPRSQEGLVLSRSQKRRMQKKPSKH